MLSLLFCKSEWRNEVEGSSKQEAFEIKNERDEYGKSYNVFL